MNILTNILQSDLSYRESICLYLLYKGKHDYVDSILEGYSDYNKTDVINKLISLGYIVHDDYIEYTKKTIDAFRQKSKPKNRSPQLKLTKDIDWINDFRRLFLVVRSGGMGSKATCIKHMNKVIAAGYNKKQIIEVTENYLANAAKDNYKYAMNADNFIHKSRKDKDTNELITSNTLLTLLEESNIKADTVLWSNNEIG